MRNVVVASVENRIQMSNAFKMGVTTCDMVQDEIKSLHGMYGSWREVQKHEHPDIPFGTLSRIANDGYVPKKWYLYFGIPLPANVIAVAGIIPNGSQALLANQCSCGAWFISNHPRRRKCFVCSPYRGNGKVH